MTYSFPDSQIQPHAKVIADSISEYGDRLTTLEVTFNRFVLAEFNTHRVFSRSSASSRAIPVAKQLAKVREHPAWPQVWASEQPGMQGGTELTGEDKAEAWDLFSMARDYVVELIEAYYEDAPPDPKNPDTYDKSRVLHKSLVNRLLEPFMWHTVIVSSTQWDNFFAQRCSPLAQPEIRVAAELMETAIQESEPRLVQPGYWHLPYSDDLLSYYDGQVSYKVPEAMALAISTARCARVSYLNHDGERSWPDDIKLYHRLVSADPMHAAPLEMVATPATDPWADVEGEVEGNFKGWHQLRHMGVVQDRIKKLVEEYQA